MNLALFEPDIPQNAGTLLRLGAALGTPVHIIEPCGFPFGADKGLKRAAMDYMDHVDLTRHPDWAAFEANPPGRLVLLTTKAAIPYWDFKFQSGDTLLLGRESSGVPGFVHERAEARLTIPMAGGLRSINVATAAAMVMGEALRQTQGP
ncbi:MAG: tRNA (cytidine(34)-2'-O)-methyltransferase [Alphaproteobacteria bacterium]